METETQLVFSTSDSFGNIMVVDYKGYRVLTFDSDYAQSGFYLEQPYAVVYEYICIMLLVLGFTTPRHVTVLGLGGGSLLRSLHHYLPQCQFSVVELREKVVEVAKDYFFIPVDERVTLSIEDAETHLNNMECGSTDILFSDLYDAQKMSPAQGHTGFVAECARVLAGDGWLVVSYHELPAEDSDLLSALKQQFGKTMICPGDVGNYILFAHKGPAIDFENAPLRIRQLERGLGTPFAALLDRLKKATAG